MTIAFNEFKPGVKYSDYGETYTCLGTTSEGYLLMEEESKCGNNSEYWIFNLHECEDGMLYDLENGLGFNFVAKELNND